MGDAGAEEVGRLREERALLRRAVREQQQKNADLETRVQTTESALREARQEVDSLSFENNRLIARLKQVRLVLPRDVRTNSQ
jgi:predicted nuclease with TOPRIM domain